MHPTFNIGDVVWLKSAPEQPMTVIKIDTLHDEYACAFFTVEGNPGVIPLPGAALTDVQESADDTA